MFFSNLVMYFIILTTAATLHAHGMKHIETAQQAAEALRPLAGKGAYWLFTLGLIGPGCSACRCWRVPARMRSRKRPHGVGFARTISRSLRAGSTRVIAVRDGDRAGT